MEFFRAGEAILRSTQPLLPFLAPSAYRSPRRLGGIARHCGRQSSAATSSRTLSTSSCRHQEETSRRQDNDDRASQHATQTGADFSALLDSAIDGSKGVPTASTGRPSHFKSAFQQRENRTPAPSTTRIPTRTQPPPSSAEEFINDMFAKSATSTPPQSNSFGRTGPLDTDGIFGVVPGSRQDVARARPPPPPPQAAPMKLDSSVGRTIHVNADKGIDVGRAFRMLEQRCAQNSVKRDFMRQRFHERPGLKRKRLKQERWRRRFKEGFRETVAMVGRMKKQGW